MNYNEWKEKLITKDEESKFPTFSSHLEAREYFKNIYGDNFKFIESYSSYDGEDSYTYHLVFDYDQYVESRNRYNELFNLLGLIDKSEFSTEIEKVTDNFRFSHQTIKIYEYGDISIFN